MAWVTDERSPTGLVQGTAIYSGDEPIRSRHDQLELRAAATGDYRAVVLVELLIDKRHQGQRIRFGGWPPGGRAGTCQGATDC